MVAGWMHERVHEVIANKHAKLDPASLSRQAPARKTAIWGISMQKTLAFALSCAIFSAQGAIAGSVSDPVVERDVIVEDVTASSSSATAIVAFLAAILLAPPLSK